MSDSVPYIGWIAAAVLSGAIQEEAADELFRRLKKTGRKPELPSEVIADVREQLRAMMEEGPPDVAAARVAETPA